jgi:hypothetical protein
MYPGKYVWFLLLYFVDDANNSRSIECAIAIGPAFIGCAYAAAVNVGAGMCCLFPSAVPYSNTHS